MNRTPSPDGRCCVFQPFDKGPFDKRYSDVLSPAILAAGLEPYRVDKDDDAVIPIETLHEEIRSAVICLADISTRNPNVMYELGYAIAASKDVVIVCARAQSRKFPFDIRHRGILLYDADSVSDFEGMKNSITARLEALLKKQVTTMSIASESPVKSTHGLQPNEIAALALVMANVDSSSDTVTTGTVKQDMEKAGFTRLATQLALTRLSRMGLVEAVEDGDINGNTFVTYRMLKEGEDWLLDNQHCLELRRPARETRATSSRIINEDEIPF